MTWDTKIVHDLRIVGDNFPDFLEAVTNKFGTDFSNLHWSDYAPTEGEVIGIWPRETEIIKRCKKITIYELHQAILAGYWTDNATHSRRRVVKWTLTYSLLVSIVFFTLVITVFSVAMKLVLTAKWFWEFDAVRPSRFLIIV